MTLKEDGLTLFEAARAVGVPFSDEVVPKDRYVVANGLKFHYLAWGSEDRESILLLHGGLQQAHSWDFVALALCADYHVVVLDARGHGDSQWAMDGDYSLEAHQGDLESLVEALELRRFVLVGHSMGGRNAYVFASRHPELVKALVIVDVGPESMSSGESRIRSFRELPDELDSYAEFATRVQEYTGRSREQVLGALKYTIRQRTDGKWTWKYDKQLRAPGYRPGGLPPEELWEALAGISCPTLILRGSRSDIFAADVMERMLQVIPESTSAEVPEAGHLVAGDNPAGFLEAIAPWLQRVM